jgi:hypothetical protein
MKMNKWTLGLAAVGLVSLTPALRAADATPGPQPILTAMSATTISGYVDTSAVWNPGTGNTYAAPYAFNGGKADGFNLDAVAVRIAKPLDEGKWSAGYVAEVMLGPDATAALGGAYPIREAYVSLRANVGNGLDFKLGQWDNLLGYEGTDAMNDPNFTRSYGYTIEPTEHIGLLGSYIWGDPDKGMVQFQGGVADELQAGLTRNVSGTPPPGMGGPNTYTTIESKKGIVSLLTLQAPKSWGGIGGSALYAGLDYGPGNATFGHPAVGTYFIPAASSHVVDKLELYVGATLMTPVKGLTLGASWDTINNSDLGPVEGYASAVAGYLSFHVPDTKLTLNTRAEFAHGSAFDNLFGGNYWINSKGKVIIPEEAKVFAVTETIEYKLWGDNVITRLEARWDTSMDGSPMFGGTAPGYGAIPGGASKNNELMIAANVIYKF